MLRPVSIAASATVVAIAAIVIAAGCSGDAGTAEPPADVNTALTTRSDLLARCGSRGAPVTLAKLIRVFRANGITLDIHRRGCRRPESDPHHPDATNAGSSGLEPRAGVFRTEGHVICDVARAPRARNREVEVVKYPTDTETHVGFLNVGCAVYPSDAASERKQVNRLENALEALARVT